MVKVIDMKDNIFKPFEGVLGNNCELRLIEYLLPLKGIEFNRDELAEEMSVSKTTISRIVKKFLEWEVLKLSKTEDKISYYSINEESSIIEIIEKFNTILIEKILGDEKLYEIHEYLLNNNKD
jgi:DNA-binding transcriptional regulator GbsR (MarR family)